MGLNIFIGENDMLLTGIDILQRENFARLRGKKIGLLTNTSAVNAALISTYRLFVEHLRPELQAFFAPEHGFSVAAPDGALLDSMIDPATGLPIHSLYGKSFRPTADMLKGLDVVVCDIQDIGVRYYTFAWTVIYMMQAAGEYGVPVMILDRPNPLGGVQIEGAPLEEAWRSIVGEFPVPTRHGLTIGELAYLVNQVWTSTPAALEIVRCEGWQRGRRWSETGRVWIPTSPNMPQLSTVTQYAGACLVEGTTLSEGRGTALPFEIVGAPHLDGVALADTLNAQGWDGVRFRPTTFIPNTSKYAGETCQGVQVHVTDPAQFNTMQVWLGVLQTIYHRYGFEWKRHFNLLIGSDRVAQQIEQNLPLSDIMAGWDAFGREFESLRAESLLYE